MSLTITSALTNVFASPSQLFSELKEGKGLGWQGLLLLVIITAAITYWFFSGMTPEWIVNQQLAQMPEMSPAEAKNVEAAISQSAASMPIIATAFGSVFAVIMITVFAGYYRLVGGGQFTFGEWFRFSVWTSMPMLLNSLAIAVFILLASDGNLPFSTMNFASLNSLVLGYAPGHALYNWANSVNAFSFWTIALAALGLQQWKGCSFGKALTLAAVPVALIWGVWLLVASL